MHPQAGSALRRCPRPSQEIRHIRADSPDFPDSDLSALAVSQGLPHIASVLPQAGLALRRSCRPSQGIWNIHAGSPDFPDSDLSAL